MTSASPYVLQDPQRRIFKVNRRAFTDEQVLALERAELFEKCWLYLGHGSEIKRDGAYKTRSVGGRPLIFNRDANGVVRAFFNTCPHRGMRVCREASGRAKMFTCFYHGWVFAADGTLRDQPGKDAYPEGFADDHQADLVAVPRLESHRDFWFVNFDRNAQSLSDYLAGAKEYIDLIADQGEFGMEIISGAQNYGIQANWKLIMENSLDGYHAVTTHATYFDYLRNLKLDFGTGAPPGAPRELGNGHAVIEYEGPWGRAVGKWASTMGEENRAAVDAVYAALEAKHGPERARRIAHGNRNIGIFPNLVLNDTMGLVVRTFYPVAVDRMEISSWTLGPKDEDPGLRKFRLSNFIEFLGPGGLATPDDVEALQNCQRGYANQKEASWSDVSKGLGRPDGEQRADDEAQIRAFWKQWDKVVSNAQPEAAA